MGFDPGSIMFLMGMGQGIMGYGQGMAVSRAAEADAANAQVLAGYEREARKNNVAIVEAEEDRAIEQQKWKNRAVMGSVSATLGAAGVAFGGTVIDTLVQNVILGHNKEALIRSAALNKVTGVKNAGDLAVWKQETIEAMKRREAKEARSGAAMSLGMGALAGTYGMYSQGGSFGDLFGDFGDMFSGLFGDSGVTALTAPIGGGGTSNWLYFTQ